MSTPQQPGPQHPGNFGSGNPSPYPGRPAPGSRGVPPGPSYPHATVPTGAPGFAGHHMPGGGAYGAGPYGGPPASEQKASGVAGIIAGVLGIIVMIWNVLVAVGQLDRFEGGSTAGSVIMFSGSIVVALCFLTASILLFMRKHAGRVLTIVATALMTILYIVVIVMHRIEHGGQDLTILAVVVILLPPFIAALLALLPVTSRWCEQARRPEPAIYPGHR